LISSSEELVAVYLFSYGTNILEEGGTFFEIGKVFLFYLIIKCIYHIIRLYSKNNIWYLTNKYLWELKRQYLQQYKNGKEGRAEFIQALENFNNNVWVFVNNLKEGGITIFLSLITVPFVFFITNVWLFWLVIALFTVNLVLTFAIGDHYRSQQEQVNRAQEAYLNSVFHANGIKNGIQTVIQKLWKLTKAETLFWLSVHYLKEIYYFAGIMLIVYFQIEDGIDISEFVLLTGYLTQFINVLNRLSALIKSFKVADAGVDELKKFV
jgi:ABC-type bacteriocin/lantibiotic exporter with double-glycine peptidase domain